MLIMKHGILVGFSWLNYCFNESRRDNHSNNVRFRVIQFKNCTEYVVLLLVDGSSEVLHLSGRGGRLARRFGGVLSWTTVDSLENGLWVHELRCEIRIVRTYKTACYTIRTFQIFLKYRADEF